MSLPTTAFLKQTHWIIVIVISTGGVIGAYYAGQSKSATVDATTELRVTTLERRVDALNVLIETNADKIDAKIDRAVSGLDARLRGIETGVARIEQSLSGKTTGR